MNDCIFCAARLVAFIFGDGDGVFGFGDGVFSLDAGVSILTRRLTVVAFLQYFNLGPLIYLQSGQRQFSCGIFLHLTVVPIDADRFPFSVCAFRQYFNFIPFTYLQSGGKQAFSCNL